LLASCGLALLLAEGAVRVFAPHSRDHALPGRLFDLDERLGWKLKPNRQVTHRTRHFEVTYAINESGFRDRTHHHSNGGDVHRLLVYGDSQVFGWGVPEESRFSNLLERSVPSLEVWNLGVPAYGLDQELIAYGSGTPTLNADEVIFYVSEATLTRSRHRRMFGRPKPMFVKHDDGVLRAMPPASVGLARWPYEALSSLYLPQFVSRRLAMVRAGLAEDRQKREPDSGVARSARWMGDFDRDLLTLGIDSAAAKGHRATVLAAMREDDLRELRDFCGRRDVGLITVDLTRLRRDFMFGKDDPHWTVAGHRWVADEILSQVDWSARR
jgi:hypothetical protein